LVNLGFGSPLIHRRLRKRERVNQQACYTERNQRTIYDATAGHMRNIKAH
jgi:hypothetical protein